MKTHRVLTHLLACAFCATSLCRLAFAQELPPAPHISGTQPFHASIAGTCTNKDDFSFTGAPIFNGTSGAYRIACNLLGDSTHGQLTFHALAEEQFATVPCALPGGGAGIQFPLKGFTVALTFHAQQDQLFLILSSGSECGALSPPIGFGKATFSVAGGTGRFQGASGTMSIAWQDVIVAGSALGGDGFFSGFGGTLDGFVNLK